jgi:putative transposase
MDNGTKMNSELFVSWAQEHGVELRFIQLGNPNQNAYVEHFNKSVRKEVLNALLFHSLDYAQEDIEDLRKDYNGIRSHVPLGDRTYAVHLPRVVKTENCIYDLATCRGILLS